MLFPSFRRAFMLALTVLLVVCISFGPAFSSVLSEKLAAYVESSGAASSADVSVYVSDSRGNVIFERNSKKPMAPASNLKILTTASALRYLGPEYRYCTSIYGTPIDEKRGVMEGSLYLVGSGDPTFCEPFMDNPTSVFEDFAKELAKKGLRRFTGDIIGDDSVFDREFTGLGWKDSYILDAYAAQCAGLSLNANLVQITLGYGFVSFVPDCSIISVNDMTVEGGYTDVKVSRKKGTNDVTVKGVKSPWDNGGATITVHNPSLFSLDAFEKVLRSQCIYNGGATRLIPEIDSRYKYSEFVELARHESPNMIEILIPMMKESDNLLAQHIFKTVGAEVAGKGSLETSRKAVLDMLSEAGVSTDGIVIADGCGLSPLNRISTSQIGSLLASMLSDKNSKLFLSTMPVSGVDGTLKYRMPDLNVWAKTGTIAGCSALSGYVVTVDGDTAVFSIISNNHSLGSSVYKGFEDAVVDIIAKTGIR